MPYKVVQNGEEFCVYKHDEAGEPVGEAMGCHDTRPEAEEQMAALYASENATKAIKAYEQDGRWMLDILAVPFGGPIKGKDRHGEYFSAKTRIHEDKYPSPPLVYYHGLDEAKGTPLFIGKASGAHKQPDGWWYRGELDRTADKAVTVWEAAKAGNLQVSSGSIRHLVRYGKDGEILEWPIGEISLWERTPDKLQASNSYAVAYPALKALYEQAGLTVPTEFDPTTKVQAEATGEQREPEATPRREVTKTHNRGDIMEGEVSIKAEDVQKLIDSALQREREAKEAEAKRLKEVEDAKAEAVKAAREEWEKEQAPARRLPGGKEAPVIGKFGYMRPFDHASASDLACAAEVIKGGGRNPSENLYKAIAVKLCDEKDAAAEYGKTALKAAGFQFEGDAIKANEVNYSTLANYGDEWVPAANSTSLWAQIRQQSNIVPKLPSIEVPQGSESLNIRLESGDPVFYKVAQVASDAATGGLSRPSPTVTSSRLGTASTSLTLSKMGARVRWSGELDEDSIIPWAPQLRQQLATAGAEYMDHIIIDGDTRTTASTNINDIGGTPAGTEAFLLANGFRYVALATSGRNRSGGAIDEDDFVATMALLGTAGKAADPNRCAFIVGPHTHRKMLTEITALKTADVYPGSPTISSGQITQIWGYPVIQSWGMGYVHTYSSHTMTGYEHKFNTAGKVDQNTAANNTTGSLLLVRWDRWFLGWKRRMTIETTRYPEWDGSEIVALARFGLVYRDTTNAAAISYNLTV